MSDDFTEVTSQSWGSRIMGSIGGVVFGIVIILISVVLLWWNEGRAVKTAKGLSEGAGVIISAQASPINPANDHKLIHLTGKAETEGELEDRTFKIGAKALRLRREVQMYQWEEEKKSSTEKKLGGGTETVTTYSYKKEWSSKLIDSSDFKHPEGHQNPARMLASSTTIVAKDATLGAFDLPEDVIAEMPGDKPLAITDQDLDNIPRRITVHNSGGEFYFGENPDSPEVGDQKVGFTVLEPGVFSIIAQQSGNTLEPYLTHQKTEILLVEAGSVSPALMFHHAASANNLLTWIFRLVGFVMMVIGLSLLFGPLQTLADVVPFIGNIIGAGTGFAAFLLGFGISLVIIALAWIAYRPLLGLFLLALAIAGVVWAKKRGVRRMASAKK